MTYKEFTHLDGQTFMEVKVCSINGFSCESFDGQNFAKLVGADANFDESDFHDL
jgi:hypothetical protein